MNDLKILNIRDWIAYLLPGGVMLLAIVLFFDRMELDPGPVLKGLFQNQFLAIVSAIAFAYTLGQAATWLGTVLLIRPAERILGSPAKYLLAAETRAKRRLRLPLDDLDPSIKDAMRATFQSEWSAGIIDTEESVVHLCQSYLLGQAPEAYLGLITRLFALYQFYSALILPAAAVMILFPSPSTLLQVLAALVVAALLFRGAWWYWTTWHKYLFLYSWRELARKREHGSADEGS